jgi:hypothetical protein
LRQPEAATDLHAATLCDTPNRCAVRVRATRWKWLHRGSIAGLPAGPLPLTAIRGTLALLAAQLFSHREELALLAACRDPVLSDAESGGALVDAGTCARIAVAGYDVDSELLLGNPVLLLEAAGDLLHGGGGPGATRVATQNTEMNYLLLGLKWHAAVVD